MASWKWMENIGAKLRPEAILDVTKGGDKAKNEWRRLGNSATGTVGGAITGFATGGPVGAIVGAGTGGIEGYQSKKPVTGREALTNFGKGAASGYVEGSGLSALGAGGAGWTMGLGGTAGSAGSTTPAVAGANGATTASEVAANAAPAASTTSAATGLNYADLINTALGGDSSGQAGGTDEMTQRLNAIKAARVRANQEAYQNLLNSSMNDVNNSNYYMTKR